jgi:hypothetical protein
MIFINGIQRSGTNFACKIYGDKAIDSCYPYQKHDIKIDGVDPDASEVHCMIKNPYTWVESLCFRSQVDIVDHFPSFNLRDSTDHLGPNQINLHRLCLVYKLFYSSWLSYPKTKLIHYEQLLGKNRQIQEVPHSPDWTPDRARGYLRHQPQHLNSNHISIINNNLGTDFIQKLGYQVK